MSREDVKIQKALDIGGAVLPRFFFPFKKKNVQLIDSAFLQHLFGRPVMIHGAKQGFVDLLFFLGHLLVTSCLYMVFTLLIKHLYYGCYAVKCFVKCPLVKFRHLYLSAGLSLSLSMKRKRGGESFNRSNNRKKRNIN